MQFVTELSASNIPSSATMLPVSDSLSWILNFSQFFYWTLLEWTFVLGMYMMVSQYHCSLKLEIFDSIIPKYSDEEFSKLSKNLTSITSLFYLFSS